MINQKDFTDFMNKLNGAFAGINNVARLQRYYDAIKNLPPEALNEIAESFLDSSKQMPLPADFRSAASSWKRNFYSKNGYWPDQEKTIEVIYEKINCEICDDLGIVLIKHHEKDSFKSLMRCSCNAGLAETLIAPQWDSSLSGAFKVNKIPSEWFKPNSISENTDENIFNGIMEKLQRWQNFKKKAQDYWQSIGYK